MSFISYAQNFEDVMLWRALSHVADGFYIDIGAQDPVIDSVSLVFYEHGWKGVHVEPTFQYSEKLRLARPDETVMQVAIGSNNSNDTLIFFEFHNTGLSTADPVIAERHKQSGLTCSQTQVSLISLDTLLDKFAARTVHWLKLDVEGLEKNVLESWQLAIARPWILVIESTVPSTQTATHSDWETIVLSKGYEFAYFDGLNRFYVSKEQSSLKQAFDRPPNVFDGFALSGLASQPFCNVVEARAQKARAQAQKTLERAYRAESQAQKTLERAHTAEAQTKSALEGHARTEILLNQVMSSRSWRITAPLRWCSLQARRLRVQMFSARAKALNKNIDGPIIRRGVAFINARPALRQRVVSVILRLGLYHRMRSLYSKSQGVSSTVSMGATDHQNAAAVANLSPRAQRVYQDLEDAIEKNKQAH
jgi:FkbM family methyltransferase